MLAQRPRRSPDKPEAQLEEGDQPVPEGTLEGGKHSPEECLKRGGETQKEGLPK